MMLIFWCLFLVGNLPTVFSLQHSDCLHECDKYEVELTKEFEECMKECDAKRLSNAYPAAPSNATFRPIVVIEEDKIIETTIYWTAPQDTRRTGFSLHLKTVDTHCERDFPGYFTSNIGPMDRSLPVPLFDENEGQMLAFQHGCTYSLEMHSKPYPVPDTDYILRALYTVPDCIGQYCKCEEGAVPAPTELAAKEEGNGIRVVWKYTGSQAKVYKFHLTLHKRLHAAIGLFKNRDVFNWEIIDEKLAENEASSDGISHSVLWPRDLKRNEEYRISLFARDHQFCTSTDENAEFVSSGSSSLALPSESSGNVTFVTATVVEYPTQAPKATPTPSLVRISLDFLDYRVLLLMVVVVLFLTFMFASCFFCVYYWKKHKRERDLAKLVQYPPSWSMAHSRRHSILENNVLYRHVTPKIYSRSESEWKISSNDVVVGGVIGEGAFGLVCLGTLKGPRGVAVRVAIKQLKTNAIDEEKLEFKRELDIMKQVGSHPNIVCMYGVIDEGDLQCMVMEFVPYGDLKHYLQNLRKQLTAAVSTLKSSLRLEDGTTFQDSAELQYTLDPNELTSFAAQVANGMAHLEQLSITHRDLAARNILVGENKQLKISDFGMSRPGVYVKISKGVIPLRWLSPEAIKDNIYSTKSDVWAYGVVLWEIVTLGGFPYATISDKDLLNWLETGNRLEKPRSCSEEMYVVMKECWRFNEEDRPSFTCICDCLGGLTTPYVDFDPLIPLPPPDAFDLIDTATLVSPSP